MDIAVGKKITKLCQENFDEAEATIIAVSLFLLISESREFSRGVFVGIGADLGDGIVKKIPTMQKKLDEIIKQKNPTFSFFMRKLKAKEIKYFEIHLSKGKQIGFSKKVEMTNKNIEELAAYYAKSLA